MTRKADDVSTLRLVDEPRISNSGDDYHCDCKQGVLLSFIQYSHNVVQYCTMDY